MNIRKIYVLIILITFNTVCHSKTTEEIPIRPTNVPKNATWEGRHSPIWSIGSYDEGNIILWYKDGTLLYREILVKANYKKSMRYHKNGKIHKIGQWQYFKDKYYNNDGYLIGWIEIGKWKEYGEDGNLIHEYCYTPNEKGGDVAMICGEEIFYNKDSSVKEKRQSKYTCNYGCEELEYKDSIK
jgi:hypothetical protein